MPVFDQLKNIVEFDVSRNNLTHSEFGIFVHFRNFSVLNLYENQLNEIDLSHLPPLTIQKLDISENDIFEIEGSLSYVFPSLHELDLRGNNFNCSHLKSLFYEFDQ